MSNLSARGYQLKSLCDSISAAVSDSIRPMIGQPSGGMVVAMGADGTPTKSIDRIAENTVLLKLKHSGLGIKVLSEERGDMLIGNEPEYYLLLDPLDGTFNAIKGIPFYSLSLYLSNKKCQFGYVSDLARGTKYYAEAGGGAYVEGEITQKLNISDTSVLRDFSISAYTLRPNTYRIVSLGDKVRRIRTFGSTSLEMALVASGKLDAFVDVRGTLRVVDVAAGKLILEEARGKVTDSRGEELYLNGNMWIKTDLIGSNGQLHKELIKLVGSDGH
jgi:myo-inositol-1(or 4)-monophosphatase